MSFKVADAFVEITAKDNVDAGKRTAEAKLGSIRDKTVKINTKADESGIRAITARLAALRDKTLKVKVDSNGATSGLGNVTREANRADAAVSRLGSRSLPDISGRMLIGLAAIPAAAGAAAAAIAAIPAAGASLGLVGGVLAGSFSGIGDALKGFTADRDKAAAGGGGNSAANAARSSARAIRDATQQINDARRDQARTARDSAQQIEDAERAVQDAARSTARAQRGVADARREAARTARDSAQQIKDAEESVSEAQQASARSARDNARAVISAKQNVADAERAAARAAESAADQVASAERRLSDAQRASTQAQKDLNRAREQAVQDLADLQERASDAARDEKGAVLDLAEARLRLDRVNNDALSTDLDKAKAAYDVEVAEDRLKDAQKAATDAAGASNLAQAKGVEGADAVVDAKQKVADATQSATDAQHSLKDALQSAADTAQDSAERIANAQQSLVEAQERAADAQVEANQRIQDAVENLSQARTRAAEANADAQERIVQAQEGMQDSIRAQEDAERQLARTKQQAADSAADAAERVANAEQGLKDAQEDANAATAAGAAEVSKFALAMAKLSPLQQQLVRELLRWKDIMKDLGRTASDAFLPGFIQMLKDAEGLQGIFNSALQRTGTIMGDTARKMGELFKSEDFKRNLDDLLKSADPITKSIGQLFVDMTGSLVKFGAKMAPVAEGFAHFIDSVSKGFQGFFDQLSDTKHVESFKSIWESLGRIHEVLLPILGRLIGKLADELAPILERFATWLETHQADIQYWCDKFAEWAPLIGGVVLGLKGLKILASVVGWAKGIVGALDDITSAAKKAVDWLGKVNTPGGGPDLPGGEGTPGKGGKAGKFGKVAKGVGIVAGVGALAVGADAALPQDGSHYRGELSAISGAIMDPQSALDKLKADFAAFPDEFRNSPFMRFFRDELPAWWDGLWGSNGSITTSFTGGKTSISTTWSSLWEGIKSTWDSFTGWMSGQWATFKTNWNGFWDGIGQKVSGAWDSIKTWVSTKWTELTTWLSAQWTTFKTNWAVFWDGVGQKVSTVWDSIKTWVSTKWNELTTWLSGQWATFKANWTAFWDGVYQKISAAWTSIKTWVTTKWSEITTWLSGQWATFKANWNALWDTVGQKISAAWDTIKAKVSAAWTWIKGTVWDPMVNFVKVTIPGAFDTAATAIGRAWDRIKELAAAPVRFVVNTVYNGGIVPAWNKVAGLVGLPGLGTVNLGFAAGGVVPGMDMGYDTIPAMLRGGEGILVPEAVRMLGGESGIHALNRRGEMQHFASGGVAGYSGSASATANGAMGSVQSAGLIQQLIADAAGTARNLFGSALGSVGGTPGGGQWRDALTRMPGKMVDGLIEKIKAAAASLAASFVGGGAAPAGSGAVVAQVQQAASALGWGSGAQWNALSWLISHESGWNPNAQNPTSTAYGLFQFLNSTWGSVGGSKTSNPFQQAVYGLRYIQSRYGSPTGAQAFWQAHHWYDQGGVASGVGMLPKRTPKPERVLSPDQTAAFERLVDDLGSPRGVGGVTVQNLHVNVTGVLDFRQRDVATRQVVADLMAQIDAIERSHA